MPKRRRRAESKTDCRRLPDSGHVQARRLMARRSPGSNRSAPRSRSWNERDRAPCRTRFHAILPQERKQLRCIGQSLVRASEPKRVMDEEDAERPARKERPARICASASNWLRPSRPVAISGGVGTAEDMLIQRQRAAAAQGRKRSVAIGRIVAGEDSLPMFRRSDAGWREHRRQ